MWQILFEMVTCFFFTQASNGQGSIKARPFSIGTDDVAKIFWDYPNFCKIDHLIQLWPQTILQWIQSFAAMKPDILPFSSCWVIFALVVNQNLTGKFNILHRRDYCSTALPRLLKQQAGKLLPQRYIAFTGDSPPKHYSSWMVTWLPLKPWNNMFCVGRPNPLNYF